MLRSTQPSFCTLKSEALQGRFCFGGGEKDSPLPTARGTVGGHGKQRLAFKGRPLSEGARARGRRSGRRSPALGPSRLPQPWRASARASPTTTTGKAWPPEPEQQEPGDWEASAGATGWPVSRSATTSSSPSCRPSSRTCPENLKSQKPQILHRGAKKILMFPLELFMLLKSSSQQRLSYTILNDLAMALIDGTVFEIVQGLLDIQHLMERNLYNQRLKLHNEHRVLKQEMLYKHKEAQQGCKPHNLPLLKAAQQRELELGFLRFTPHLL
uniref:uncharacterized protein LOC114586651 isoform X2 n=1 Tax=Podarcis muralis TaxID=64176 RepID=UPI00109FDB8F|nr:uncharacterized protein LOC114586651 isoform X2 [Podarcis muralis]